MMHKKTLYLLGLNIALVVLLLAVGVAQAQETPTPLTVTGQHNVTILVVDDFDADDNAAVADEYGSSSDSEDLCSYCRGSRKSLLFVVVHLPAGYTPNI